MPIRIYHSFCQLFLSFHKMDSESGETVENGEKKRTDDEVQDLIELLKEKPCLWNIFLNEYTKRQVKERVYAELVEHFGSSLQAISEVITMSLHFLNVGPTYWTH